MRVLFENAGNIASGIGTGIISSILVSKIFLIFQNLKSDFIEVKKNTSGLESCKSMYMHCYTKAFEVRAITKLEEEDAKLVKSTLEQIDEIATKELDNLDHICKVYMDKLLVEMMEVHRSVLVIIKLECDENFIPRGKDEILSLINMVLNNYDIYEKKLFKRVLTLVFKDKLVLFICIMFFFFGVIACIS